MHLGAEALARTHFYEWQVLAGGLSLRDDLFVEAALKTNERLTDALGITAQLCCRVRQR